MAEASSGASRREANAEFVWQMEDVLDVYTRPYDPRRPLVCLDETSKQLLARRPRRRCRRRPGRPRGRTTSTSGSGVANLFLVCEPLARLARRSIVTERRTTRRLGRTASRTWSTSATPTPSGSCWCMDNLNTHTPASLYEAFPPAEAKRLADKLEIHYTPKHGRWLNMAEIELSVLGRQCLDRRIPDRDDPRGRGRRLGGARATPPAAPSTGASPPPTPASSSSASTPQFTSDRALGPYRGQ